MTKPRKIRKQKTANRNVTVKLDGWKGEVRQISVVGEYWYVALEFEKKGTTLTHTVFETDDYSKALAKYNAFVKIVED